jgi:hypothetical protein
VKNPVLQEKRQEHVTFQKYALELMELVTGKAKHNGAEIEASLANINRVCFKLKKKKIDIIFCLVVAILLGLSK